VGLTANKFAGYGRKYLYNPGRASNLDGGEIEAKEGEAKG